jgi:hypothetical protein
MAMSISLGSIFAFTWKMVGAKDVCEQSVYLRAGAGSRCRSRRRSPLAGWGLSLLLLLEQLGEEITEAEEDRK